MVEEELRQIWPEWQIVGNRLGKGSYGEVYRVVRRDNNLETYAAIKVISIPADQAEVDSLRSEGMTLSGTETYFKSIVDDFVKEIKVMESMKGTTNIVSIEDYQVVKKSDTVGWNIYIRMQLLRPFTNYLNQVGNLPEQGVIKLGVDICNALDTCAKLNVIHRDIKPQNIFIDGLGNYKLGDFGIARNLENMSGSMTRIGTPDYMAPEVFRGGQYDSRVDIYSLGVVLYWLMNGRRLPLLDSEQMQVNPAARKAALDRRLGGEPLPKPAYASPAMADVILRACAFNPNGRFATAAEMRNALIAVANGTYNPNMFRGSATETLGSDQDQGGSGTRELNPPPGPDPEGSQGKKGKKKKGDMDSFDDGTPKKKSHKLRNFILVLLVLAIIGGGVGAAMILPQYLADQEEKELNIDEADSSADADLYSKDENREIRTAIKEANDLEAAGDLDGALDRIDEAMQEYPQSEQLKAKQDALEAKVEARDVQAALDQAAGFAASEDYDGAIDALYNCLMVYPGTQSLMDKVAEYEAARDDKAISEIIANAETLAGEGKFDEAITAVEKGLKTYPNASRLQEKLEEYNASYGQQQKEAKLAQAEELAESGDYLGAIDILDDVAKEYGVDETLTQLREQYEASYKESVLAEAEKLAKSGDYLGAIDVIDDVIREHGEDENLSQKREQYEAGYRKAIIDAADDLADDGAYVEAYRKIEEGIGEVGTDDSFKDKLDAYKDLYIDDIEKQVNDLLAERSLDEARKLVEDAAKLFPNEGRLDALKAKIEDMKPVKLDALTITDSLRYTHVKENSPAKDTVGNDYYTSNLFYLTPDYYRDPAFATYYLGGEYTTIELTLAIDFNGGSDRAELTIFGDDNAILYQTGYTGRDFAPIKITLDVSEQQWVTFRTMAQQGYSPVVFMIVDAELYKSAEPAE